VSEEIVTQQSAELVFPTGEVVDTSTPEGLAYALARVREIDAFAREAKGRLTDMISELARQGGDNVIRLEGGLEIKVQRKYEPAWDIEGLEEALLEAGMSEKRISEIIETTVVRTVKAVEANKAAKANPEYAEIIAAHRTDEEKRPTISLPRG
jgi:hypothetical protein